MSSAPTPPDDVRLVLADGDVVPARDLVYDGVDDGGIHQWIAIFPIEALGALLRGTAHLRVGVLPARSAIRLNTGLGPPPSITCPRCGLTSYNGTDITEGYCGNCHDWTGRGVDR